MGASGPPETWWRVDGDAGGAPTGSRDKIDRRVRELLAELVGADETK